MALNLICQLLEDGWTYERISYHLFSNYGGETSGLSSRNPKRFCAERGFHSINEKEDLEGWDLQAITRVGHGYGRRTMQGLLVSEGINNIAQ